MGIGDWISGLIGGVSKVVDQVVTNDQEREELKRLMATEINRTSEAIERLRNEDVASARTREVTLRNTIGVWTQYASALLVILSFVALLFASIYHQVPAENATVVNVMIGSLGTIVVNIFSYWFGSSSSSARKQDDLQSLLGDLKANK